LIGGALVLIFGKIKPSVIIKNVDWVLLLFFTSLFIVVKGFETTGLLRLLTDHVPLGDDFQSLNFIHGISLLLSQVVSNVPFVILFIPVLQVFGSKLLWLALASASTLAGNATIIGAMSNLIVLESAKKYDIEIGFKEFLKPGLIITILTLILSILILSLEVFLGIL
jgi:Na+/H+ antiporter NhaD/arsenite permease-like protein